jgi:hypothetical protein
MVPFSLVAVIDLGHHVKSCDSRSAVIPQRYEGVIMKIAEVISGNLVELKFINVKRTL